MSRESKLPSPIRHHLLGSLFIAPRLPRAAPSPRQPITPCLPLAVSSALRPLIVPHPPLAVPIAPCELEASTVPHLLQAPICARPSSRFLGLRLCRPVPLEPCERRCSGAINAVDAAHRAARSDAGQAERFRREAAGHAVAAKASPGAGRSGRALVVVSVLVGIALAVALLVVVGSAVVGALLQDEQLVLRLHQTIARRVQRPRTCSCSPRTAGR
mgnify:CR=1 FL=1